jgi:Primase C terminal 2 (PriCT-2)
MTARAQLPDVLGSKPKGASDINTHTHTITFFKDQFASTLRFADLTLPQLANGMAKGIRPKKMQLPWLKLAVFGNKRTDKNCLRHNANVVEISGIEGEHDAGTMSFDAAVRAMRAANIRCLLYTSPSYEPVTKEKWRVLVPLSRNHPPDKHAGMVARVNGVLGGVFTQECFTLSQAYLFGRVAGHMHRVEVIDGDFVDQRDDTIAGQIGKGGSTGPRAEFNSSSPDPRDPEPVEYWRVEAALAAISPNCPYAAWLAVAAALYRSFGDNGFELFDRWSAKATGTAADGTPQYTRAKSLERWRARARSRSSPQARSSGLPIGPTGAGATTSGIFQPSVGRAPELQKGPAAQRRSRRARGLATAQSRDRLAPNTRSPSTSGASSIRLRCRAGCCRN